MATFALPGVFSGIDTDVLVAAEMAAARLPLIRLEEQRNTYEEKIDAVDNLEERMGHLQDLVDNLNDADSLRAVTASSSDDTIVSATASAGAIAMPHDIIVNQLAQSHRLVHTAGKASLDTELGLTQSTALNVNTAPNLDGNWISTTANGATYTFDFGPEADIAVEFAASTSYSITEVMNLINAASQTAFGYDAATIEGPPGSYQLRLTAKKYGPAGELTHVLTLGDAIDELNDAADWTKTDGEGGVFKYTYDGVSRTITTTHGMTFSEFVDYLNNDGQNPGVNASILQYGATYHMVLTGEDTGSAYAITIDGTVTTLDFDIGDFTESQVQQDSQFRVDGFPDPGWMTQSGNTLTDVIPNVTLTLKNTGTVKITLNRDTFDLKTNLENLVSIYNGIEYAMDLYVGYDPDNEERGILQGDSTLNMMLSQIRTVLTAGVPGFKDGSDTYTLAAQLGIEIDREGLLSLDTSILDDALTEDYYAVLDLIGAIAKGVSDSTEVEFNSADKTTTSGRYEVKTVWNTSNQVIEAYFRTYGQDDTGWRAATVDGYVITGKEDNPEQWLKVTVSVESGKEGTAHDQIGEVRVQHGFGCLIYDLTETFLDEVDGIFAMKRGDGDVHYGYRDAIDQLDKRIDLKERRLEQKEEWLRQKYARLEAALATLDAQRGAIDSLLTAMAAMNNTNSSSSST
ncbi:MAG: flagellar filament capping protein FliD [Planctomycetota bacterium]|jgi:flagellar hook-associated protein 2